MPTPSTDWSPTLPPALPTRVLPQEHQGPPLSPEQCLYSQVQQPCTWAISDVVSNLTTIKKNLNHPKFNTLDVHNSKKFRKCIKPIELIDFWYLRTHVTDRRMYQNSWKLTLAESLEIRLSISGNTSKFMCITWVYRLQMCLDQQGRKYTLQIVTQVMNRLLETFHEASKHHDVITSQQYDSLKEL